MVQWCFAWCVCGGGVQIRRLMQGKRKRCAWFSGAPRCGWLWCVRGGASGSSANTAASGASLRLAVLQTANGGGGGGGGAALRLAVEQPTPKRTKPVGSTSQPCLRLFVFIRQYSQRHSRHPRTRTCLRFGSTRKQTNNPSLRNVSQLGERSIRPRSSSIKDDTTFVLRSKPSQGRTTKEGMSPTKHRRNHANHRQNQPQSST